MFQYYKIVLWRANSEICLFCQVGAVSAMNMQSTVVTADIMLSVVQSTLGTLQVDFTRVSSQTNRMSVGTVTNGERIRENF